MDELQLDLTVAETPPRSPAPSAGTQRDPEPQTLTSLSDEDLRRLVVAVARVVEESQARGAETTRAIVYEAVGEMIALHRSERAETEAHLEDTMRSAGAVVQLMEGVLDDAVEVAGQTSKERRESVEATEASLNTFLQQVEKGLVTITAPVAEQLTDAAAIAQKVTDLAERLVQRLGWRPWIMAGGMALGTILLLTLLRPGWTMSSSQRTALRVGEAVIYTYANASAAERAEMRRVNRWREPGHADSAAPPPLPESR